MDDKPPIRYRKLRIAWSVAWGICCVLLSVLCIRSYSWINQAQYPTSKSQALVAVSGAGSVSIAMMDTRDSVEASTYTTRITPEEVKWYAQHRWQISRSAHANEVRLPTWFAIALLAGVGSISWLRWRFSLRTLLIATTLVAVGLGLIVWLAAK